MLQIFAAPEAEAGDTVGGVIWLAIMAILMILLVVGFRKADRFVQVIIVIAAILGAFVIVIGWRAIF